ncbi:DMT family transporter [Streptomyces sp. NPDC048639]|uniref:DMT family transporter n=1 Tax=Streptomyces sp. NPDC048639 TaxID=3365581 RepID=UPI003722060C
MSPLTLSVLLSLVSAVCYAATAIVQERVAATGPPQRLGLLRRGAWWAAMGLSGAGAGLHVLALGAGPLAIVQPLGVLTIVFVLPMAALCVGREVTAAGWRGSLMVAAGLAGLLLLTGASRSRALSGSEQLAVAVVTACAIGALVLTGWRARRAAARGLALAAAAGVSFGVSSVFVKTVAEAWSTSSVTDALPGLGVIAVLATTGVAASQASYRGAGLTAPLATVTVVNPVVAATIGIVLLDEGIRFGVAGVPVTLAAGALTAWGLVVLTADGAARERSEAHRAPRPTVEAGRERGIRIPAPAMASADGPLLDQRSTVITSQESRRAETPLLTAS